MNRHGDEHELRDHRRGGPTAASDNSCRPAIFSQEEWRSITNARRLTSRQIEIVGLIVQGKSNKQIQVKLGISSSTRRDHTNEAMKRLLATGRNEIPYRVIEAFRDLYKLSRQK